MNEAYRKYINECWVYARETVMAFSDVKEYDERLIMMVFNKVCQPYHYWKEKNT